MSPGRPGRPPPGPPRWRDRGSPSPTGFSTSPRDGDPPPLPQAMDAHTTPSLLFPRLHLEPPGPRERRGAARDAGNLRLQGVPKATQTSSLQIMLRPTPPTPLSRTCSWSTIPKARPYTSLVCRSKTVGRTRGYGLSGLPPPGSCSPTSPLAAALPRQGPREQGSGPSTCTLLPPRGLSPIYPGVPSTTEANPDFDPPNGRPATGHPAAPEAARCVQGQVLQEIPADPQHFQGQVGQGGGEQDPAPGAARHVRGRVPLVHH